MNTLDLSAFWGQFREEAEENVRAIIDGLLALEAKPTDRSTLDAIFRAAHTIKGSARMLGQNETGRLAHSMESVLGLLRSGTLTMSPPLNDALLAAVDVLQSLTRRVGEPAPTDSRVDSMITHLTVFETGQSPSPPIVAPKPAPAPEPVPVAPEPPAVSASPPPQAPTPPAESASASRTAGPLRSTIRVPIIRLDRLLNTTGELVVGRHAQEQHHQRIVHIDALVQKQNRSVQALLALLDKSRLPITLRRQLEGFRDTLLSTSDDLNLELRALNNEWEAYVASTSALVDDLEAEMMATRLQPLAGLFAPIPRAVRELSRSLGKDVTLIMEGETTEADRKIIEMLSEPLIHLVRNALDHGIESPDLRIAAGKPATATLTLTARPIGSTVQLVVADDGRGMDPARIRSRAVERNLIDPDLAARMADNEALELIWLPGFSTSEIITDISGRGVGMDVVRTSVMEVGGRIDIESTIGVGTSIIITLPSTLLTTRVLLFDISGAWYALPSTACHGGRRVRGSDIQTIEGRPTIWVDGRATPVVALAPLLGQRGPLPQPSDISTLIIIGPAQRRVALLVNHLIDEREVVVKPLGQLLAGQRLCSGGIALTDGRLVLLLNPSVLMERARETGRTMAPRIAKDTPAPRLLVAEDSFTTRELLRSILQSAGYIVETAPNGREALDKLQTTLYDLVVSDVEMPYLNGFELTRRIRDDQRLQNLPVIIITSLARESDRREGLLAGAQAYIVKSQFDQSNLLDTIRQLLGR